MPLLSPWEPAIHPYFRRAGVDGSVVLVDTGAGTTVDTDNVRHPIVGFVYGLKGFMVNLSLEGAKFTKLAK